MALTIDIDATKTLKSTSKSKNGVTNCTIFFFSTLKPYYFETMALTINIVVTQNLKIDPSK
jgi:hypothetical protein